jgi:hypothetical protein
MEWTTGVRAAAALVMVSTMGGCVWRVTLPRALPRSEPFAARVMQYRSYAPVEMSMSFDREAGPDSTFSSELRLADGQTVYASEDLLPLVGEDSTSWRHTLRAQRQERIAYGLLGATGVALAVTAASFGVGLPVRGDPTAIYAVGISSGLVAMILGTAGGIMYFTGGPHRRDAMASFDESLRRNLGVCGVGDTLVDCASGPPPTPPNVPQPGPRPIRTDARYSPIPRLRF